MAQPIIAIESTAERLARLTLDAYMLRQKVIAQNVANADSQDYQPLSVNFESQLSALRAALSAGAPDTQLEALAGAVHPYIERQATDGTAAGSAERLDDQMVDLVRNTLDYETVMTAMARLRALTHYAIAGS